VEIQLSTAVRHCTSVIRLHRREVVRVLADDWSEGKPRTTWCWFGTAIVWTRFWWRIWMGSEQEAFECQARVSDGNFCTLFFIHWSLQPHSSHNKTVLFLPARNLYGASDLERWRKVL